MPMAQEGAGGTPFNGLSATSSSTPSHDASLQDCERCSEWLSSAFRSSRPAKLLNAMGGRITRSATTGRISISLEAEEQIISPTKVPAPRPSQSVNRVMKSVSSSSALTSDSPAGVLLGSSASGNETASNSTLNNTSYTNSLPAAISGPTNSSSAVEGSPLQGKSQEDAMEVHCAVCGSDGPEGAARAFVKGPNPVAVVLCANRLHSQSEVEEVLVHELMHVYDVRIKDMDLRNCQQLAYSEVRAAREAECHGSSRFFKSICVKDRATIATKNMFPSQGRDCVLAVFEEAMKDDSPFSGGSTKLFFGSKHQSGPRTSSSSR